MRFREKKGKTIIYSVIFLNSIQFSDTVKHESTCTVQSGNMTRILNKSKRYKCQVCHSRGSFLFA